MRQTRHSLTVPRISVAALSLALAAAAGPMAAGAGAAITKPFTPSQTLNLAPGVTYEKGIMKTTGGRKQSVRVATVDPSHPDVRMRALLSNDKAVKREVVSKLTKRKATPELPPVVSTNGDMSQRDAVNAYAAPQGSHASGRELMVANACTRPTLGIDADGNPRIGKVRVHVEVEIPGLRDPRTIHRVNTHRDDKKVVLFTNRFASSTRTKAGGIEIVLDLSDKIRPHDRQQVRVLKVKRGAGNTTLRSGQAVLSMKGPNNRWVKDLRKGQTLQLVTRVVRQVNKPCGGTIAAASGWDDVVEMLGGNHFTLRNSKLAAPSKSAYPSGSQRHPRSGVGVTPDGKVLMVTVDGRRPGYSIGVTLAEMGKLMKSQGATDAFNLDGGGSTVMARRYLSSGAFKVTNRPSDGRERPATQALGVYEIEP